VGLLQAGVAKVGTAQVASRQSGAEEIHVLPACVAELGAGEVGDVARGGTPGGLEGEQEAGGHGVQSQIVGFKDALENLGDAASTKYDNYEDAVTASWGFARQSMFDASYIKLRELTLNAELPKAWSTALKLQGISLGIYTRNIILWTKAKAGIDPELAYQFQTSAQGNGSRKRSSSHAKGI